MKDLRAQEWVALGPKTRYYNTKLHRGAFALPVYVDVLLAGVVLGGAVPTLESIRLLLWASACRALPSR